MENREKPIGFFDSGVGGISVLREAVKLMPNENFIYFGDSLNAPYGTKSVTDVQDLAVKNAEMLIGMGVKAIVIACNTATSVSADILRLKYPHIPVIGVEPALKPALLHKENPKVLVMATEVTLREKKFKALLEKYSDLGEVFPLPCPGLMEWVEQGVLEGEAVEEFLENILLPYKNKVDAVVLGCTHYPFLKDVINKIVGENVVIFDGGAGTAKELKRRLAELDMENKGNEKGTVEFLNSKGSDREKALCEKLFYL
ncbi:MAG: glutamate racemase [Ruminococcaceae bacterium]|nr:glutamate racemase [Oscillospiraceae bacterium]